MKRVLIILFLWPLCSFNAQKETLTITIEITNLQNKNSPVRIAVYRAIDNFPDEKGYFKAYVCQPSSSGSTQYSIPGLEEGEYAFALFQDINDNGKLGTNIFGYPKEPFGFSNNVKPVIKAPTFSECKVKLTRSTNQLSVRMIR